MPRLNWSTLKYLARSPLEYQYRLKNPPATTPAMILGQAIHCLALEPDRFAQRFAVFDGVRRGKAWDAWQADHPGIESLKPHEADHVRACADSIRAHPVVAGLLKGARCEVKLQWQDHETGVLCRGRADIVLPDRIVDLKTTKDPAPRKFGRDAADMHYHGQLAFYHYGAIAAGECSGERLPIIIAAEKLPPFDVACYELHPEDLDAGRNLGLSLMQLHAECAAADYWPGIAPELQQLDLAPWAAGRTQINQEW